MNKGPIITIIIVVLVVVGGYFLLMNGGGTSDDGQSPTTTEQDIAVEEEGVKRTVRDQESQTQDIAVEEEGVEQTTRDEASGTEDAADDTSDVTTVRYTDEGFAPESVTVSAGQTVRFVNESSGGMWVASNDHPTHEELEGFDQLSTGDSYEFTFTQTGEWDYHNHVNSGDEGTVVVE